MRRYAVWTLLFSLLASQARSQDPVFPGDTGPAKYLGGIIFIKQGNETTVSFGGVLFPRHIKQTTQTPAGPVSTYTIYPSALHLPNALPFPPTSPAASGLPVPQGQPFAPFPPPPQMVQGDGQAAQIQVHVSDAHGLLYVDNVLSAARGTTRSLITPPLPTSKDIPVRLRYAAKVGEALVVEDRALTLRSGERTVVIFDGSRAVSIPVDWKSYEANAGK